MTADAKKIETKYGKESSSTDEESADSYDWKSCSVNFLAAGPQSPSMWAVGNRDGPLSPENITRPMWTDEEEEGVQKWEAEIAKAVEHEPSLLSSTRVKYDRPCGPMACEETADSGMARRMLAGSAPGDP